jgi:hypothetical protein
MDQRIWIIIEDKATNNDDFLGDKTFMINQFMGVKVYIFSNHVKELYTWAAGVGMIYFP